MSARRSVAERFEEKYEPEPNSGCWLWTASVDNKGYGKLGRAGGRGWTKASRVAWELYRGPIPAALLVCHHCDNPPCVNPAHLFVGTQSDNLFDAGRKGRLHIQTHPELYRVKRGPQPWRCKPPTPCVVCERPTTRRWQGRCHACNEFWRRNGCDSSEFRKVGPGAKGSIHCRIPDTTVAELRRLVESGEPVSWAARKLGISKAHASQIIRGNTRRPKADARNEPTDSDLKVGARESR